MKRKSEDQVDILLYIDSNPRMYSLFSFVEGKHQPGWNKWTASFYEIELRLSGLGSPWAITEVLIVVKESGYLEPFPFLETIDCIYYSFYKGFDFTTSIDFPVDALKLPRLKTLKFKGLLLNRVPEEVASSGITHLTACPREMPWCLIESDIVLESPVEKPIFPSIEERVEPFRTLRKLILLGLAEKNDTAWSSFIKRGLYDPRLFLFHIVPFLLVSCPDFVSHDNFSKRLGHLGQ